MRKRPIAKKQKTPGIPAKVAPSYIYNPLRVLDVLFHLQYRSKPGVVFEGEAAFSDLPSGCDRRNYYFTLRFGSRCTLMSTDLGSSSSGSLFFCAKFGG